MMHVCRVCSRLNPDAARYCHHDGAPLDGAGQIGPIAVGARPFLAPFVFPSGKACHTFNELVLACEADWDAAREMLTRGFFEGFLGSLGRGDLALAARRSAREDDSDRGLDLLLNQFPGERRSPVLVVAPREVNLGEVQRGVNRSLTLRLENQGMGLLSGNVQSEVPWLALGEAPGSASKLFQCRHELLLLIQVHGKALRSHPHPQEGRITIATNGGDTTVAVRVEVPLLPYPDGVLAGARTPREVAEKARAEPREAAPLFESGAVASWYDSNGWTYPVQGPAASGMAAVQQFFEALGLTKPPRVLLNQTNIELSGAPGGNVETFLFAESAENRPIYAHAVSESPWLHVGKSRSQGNAVRLHLRVPTVPAMPGQTLQGRAIVTANGNQRFPITVTLRILGTQVTAPVAKIVLEPVSSSLPQQRPVPLPVPIEAVRMAAVPVLEIESLPSAKARVVQLEALPPLPPLPPPRELAINRPIRNRRNVESTKHRVFPWRHLLPLAAILLVLGGAVLHDLFLPSRPHGDDEEDRSEQILIDPTPLLALQFNDMPIEDRSGYVGRTMSFGLSVRDPARPDADKRLMFDGWGRTNNTCVRIDGSDYLFGHDDIIFERAGEKAKRQAVARWIDMSAALGADRSPARSGQTRDGARSVWEVEGTPDRPCRVQVTQTVEIVPGAQSRRLDTCLIRWTIHNLDAVAHQVGLRFLLDTFIGENDGVPFTIPGKAGLCSTRLSFNQPGEVPDYIQALEKESLLSPGTVAHLQFRIPGPLESPTRVLLGGYPDAPLARLGYRQANGWFTPWDVPLVSIREIVDRQRELGRTERPPIPDSAVTLYWDVKLLEPGKKREVGFSYGLGEVASAEGEGKLLLTVGGRTVRDGEFTLTALRASPTPGEKLTLSLPSGDRFELLSPAEQVVPPVAEGSSRPISTVTWRLRARRTGRSTLTVRSSAGVSQQQTVRISPPPQGVLD